MKPEPRYRTGVLGKYARLVSSSSLIERLVPDADPPLRGEPRVGGGDYSMVCN